LTDFYADDYARLHGQLESQESHRRYYRQHVDVIARACGRLGRTIALLDFGSSYPVLVQEAIRAGMRAVAVDAGSTTQFGVRSRSRLPASRCATQMGPDPEFWRMRFSVVPGREQ
jgi:hypothetical protein